MTRKQWVELIFLTIAIVAIIFGPMFIDMHSVPVFYFSMLMVIFPAIIITFTLAGDRRFYRYWQKLRQRSKLIQGIPGALYFIYLQSALLVSIPITIYGVSPPELFEDQLGGMILFIFALSVIAGTATVIYSEERYKKITAKEEEVS